MEAREIDVMKDAARRLQEFLAGRNIKVGHAVALEALSVSLGTRNWRTVRDKLSASVQAAAPEPAAKTLADFPDGRWLIEGRYYDGSPYGDYFGGETPLEAKLCALYHRMYEDGESSFKVYSVTDRLTDEEVDSDILSFRDLDDHDQLFLKVLTTAQEVLNYLHLMSTDVMKVIELEAVVTTLRGALSSKKLVEKLNNCKSREFEYEAVTTEVVRFATDDGAVFEVDLESSLNALLEMLKGHKGRMSDTELEALCQYDVFFEFFGDEIRQLFIEHFSAQ